jgi:hypothetical protein
MTLHIRLQDKWGTPEEVRSTALTFSEKDFRLRGTLDSTTREGRHGGDHP